MTAAQLAAAFREDIPDGTYGQADHSVWTPAEQAQHRAEMRAAFRITNDYDPKPNPRRKRSN